MEPLPKPVPAGLVLANLAFLAVSGSLNDEAFLDWGWRLPFISSVLLIGLSLYVQLKLEDTEAFKELADLPSRVKRNLGPL